MNWVWQLLRFKVKGILSKIRNLREGEIWAGATAVLFLFIITSLATAEETPTATTPKPTPTIDRLAAPPTVEFPTQADEGAQLYWLYCLPCHGDQGQGLTDEWRAQYPPEESNCWQSGCHGTYGKDAPEDGFVLPTAVPPLMGEDSLTKFESMIQVYAYTQAKMPYESPGRLTPDEALAITVYLAQAHGIWNGLPVDTTRLGDMRLKPVTDELVAEPQALSTSRKAVSITVLIWGGLTTVLVITEGIWLWRRRG